MACRCPCTRSTIGVADTNSIDLSGNGATIPVSADLIVDPAPTNLLSVSGSGVLATAPPDLFVEGGVPPGSIPPIGPSTDIFGLGPDWASPCGGFLTPIGPQADILITNPTPYSFLLVATVTPAGATFALDPGARLHIGWAVDSAGVNLPPAPVTFPAASFYGGYNNTTPPGVGVCQTINPDPPIVDFASGIVLTPGDFIWFSMQTLILLVGSGPGTSVAMISGAGVRGSVRGVRL